MSRTPRRIGLLCLTACVVGTLILSPMTVLTQTALAQDAETALVVGSALVEPIVRALIDAGGTDAAPINLNVTGTRTGLNQLCSNRADAAMATRALSAEEEAACAAAGIGYLELLAGYRAIALIANPADTFAQCLSGDQIRTIYAPSSTGLVINWAQVNPEYPFQDLTLYLPDAATPAYAILASLVGAEGIRGDAETPDDIAAAVAQTPGALGVVSLHDAQAAGDSVRLLEISVDEAGCIAPTFDNIEAQLYAGAQPLYVYVNAQSASKPGLAPLLTALGDSANGGAIAALDALAPSGDSFALNADIVANGTTGRQFSGADAAFSVPTTAAGRVTIAGSPIGHSFLQNLTAAFASAYPTVTVTPTLRGDPDGFRRLCNGEIDAAAAFQELPADIAQNCADNNIETMTLNLGSFAVGLIANAQSDYLTCLTTQQLSSVWSAASANRITTWSQVSDGLPEVSMTLFAPSQVDMYGDILLLQSGANPSIIREDVEQDADPAYRAAATANVEGALTYMNWRDFQMTLASGQANITSVSVNAGNGCIAPTEESVADGSYALARPLKLIVNRAALARQDVQALVWFMVQDANYSLIESAGLVGLPISALPDMRSMLETTFTQVALEAARAAVTPEATPEAQEASEGSISEAANAEATAEVTPETTLEATAEAGS